MSSMQRSRVTCRAAAVSVLGLLWVVTAAFTCPETCDCGNNGVVDCTGRGLTVVPANIPLGTTVLNLYNNNIQNLSDADLSYLTSLEELSLYNNHIRVLPAGVFSHLTRLKVLRLMNNHIAVLQDGVFSDLTSLGTLRLDFNEIDDLSDGVFSKLTSLILLYIDNNEISSLPSLIFSHLTNLQFLRLSDNHISDLPDEIFSNLTSLRILKLNSNNIPSLPSGVFLHFTRLFISLDLSDNLISDIPDGIFTNRTRMFRLTLSGNYISDLPDEIFSNLQTTLEMLYLDNNNISSLPSKIFSNLTSLEELWLSDNHIADLPDGVFSDLTRLQELDLSDNQITDLPDEVFSHLTSLDELHLDNNNISSLPSAFSNLTSLQDLYIARNPWRCDCSLYDLLTSARLRDLIDDIHDPTCNSPPHMKGDALKEIAAENVCQSRGDCTTASADGTCACNVGWTGPFCDKEDNLALGQKASQSSTFANGTGAEKAVDGSSNCSQTDLEYEPWWKVDLAGYYSVSRVSIKVPLLQLDTAGTTLTVRVGPNEDFTQNDQCGQNYTTERLNTLAIIASCDPPMYGRYVSVQAMPPGGVNTTDLTLCEVEVYVTGICCNNTISITNGQITASNGFCSGNSIQFSCDTGYELVGSSSTVCRDNYWEREIPTCQPSTVSAAIIVGISTGIALIVIVAVVFFVRKCRTEEENYMVDFPPDEGERPTERSPKYDVFISYSSKESPWVNDNLLADLEKIGYRVCLDERDFVGGKPILNNIADAIYQSRKVILVMSKNFIKSGWCRHELNVAWTRKLDLQDKCVVVVKYDNCKIPRELAKLTYLDWTKQKGRETFWDKLHESLGKPGVSDEACAVSDNQEREELLQGNVE